MGRSKLWITSAMLVLSACSGEGGSGGTHQEGSELDSGLDAAALADAAVSPGDSVDLNGDGIPDGVAVDTNMDGVVDGVDTNGDGMVDAPVPPTGTPIVPQVPITTPVMCGDVVCKCSDGKDDDADGLIDLADPECVASWDNDESTFATGIPGDNRDEACQDCFFDGNSGSGNDGCRLPTSCLTDGNASSGHGSCSSCEQSDQCKNFCKAYTPNGCDCFGCCGVRLANDTTVNILIGSAGCNIDGNSVTGCTACVPNDSCVNTCGRCELCPGKTLADLPADCAPPTTTPPDAGTGQPNGDGGTTQPPPPPPPPPAYSCDDGAALCNATTACPTDYDCVFGCCALSPIILL